MRNKAGIDDYFQECYMPNQTKISPEQFDQSFCQVCKNLDCIRAGWAESSWVERMSTQVDRLLDNPNFADPRDPQYNRVREHDFPSLLQEAIRVEIVTQRNDWSIPTQEDVDNILQKGKVQTIDKSSEKESSTTNEQNLTSEKPLVSDPPNPEPNPQIAEGFSPQNNNPSSEKEILSLKSNPQNPFVNTPFPREGLMADGSEPVQNLTEKVQPRRFVADAWTSPEAQPKPKNLVQKGARIQMGTPKKDK